MLRNSTRTHLEAALEGQGVKEREGIAVGAHQLACPCGSFFRSTAKTLQCSAYLRALSHSDSIILCGSAAAGQVKQSSHVAWDKAALGHSKEKGDSMCRAPVAALVQQRLPRPDEVRLREVLVAPELRDELRDGLCWFTLKGLSEGRKCMSSITRMPAFLAATITASNTAPADMPCTADRASSEHAPHGCTAGSMHLPGMTLPALRQAPRPAAPQSTDGVCRLLQGGLQGGRVPGEHPSTLLLGDTQNLRD